MDPFAGAIDKQVGRHLLCVGCDYDLRTIADTALCPECGLPVDESVRAVGGWSRPRLLALRCTIWAYALSVATWGGFDLALLTPPSTSMRRAVAVVLVIHGLAICFAAIAGTYASSRQSRSVRFGIVLSLSLLIAGAGSFVVLAALRVVSIGSLESSVFFATAGAARLLVVTFAAWWLLTARRTFTNGWTRWGKAWAAAVAIVVAAWCAFGIAGVIYKATPWQGAGVVFYEILAPVTLGVDAIASAFIAVMGLTMLREIKRRLRATRPLLKQTVE